MAQGGAALCQIVSDAELSRPLQTVDAIGWLGGDISGWSVLCLAGGGGRQSCLYAAAGASVTVLDLSPEMLELDRQAARQHSFSVRCIEGSMTDCSMLDPSSFDLVVHPVSTCYVPDVQPVFASVARVLRPGGLYISQHKSPISLQASAEPNAEGRYQIEQRYASGDRLPEPKPGSVASRLREPGAVEFLHTLEQLIGGIARCGLVIEDLIEPDHRRPNEPLGSFAHRAQAIAPYLRIKARRQAQSQPHPKSERAIWLP
ncbi:MAG: class I SAM-dependent methyltransferase [Planctomycetota bacterium]